MIDVSYEAYRGSDANRGPKPLLYTRKGLAATSRARTWGFCVSSPRTPHESKGLTGLRGSKRYTVRRESRGQFLNNPCGWLNLQAEGLGKPNMRVRMIRGGAYLSDPTLSVGLGGLLGGNIACVKVGMIGEIGAKTSRGSAETPKKYARRSA